MSREFGIPASAENIAVGPGAKIFEQLFCEAFLNPGDGVLVFSPHFPTYPPNIQRRQARVVLTPLREANQFRPDIDAVEKFLNEDSSPRAIFLNTPHNPTGGVATEEDLANLADLIRGRDVAVFCDEPYCHMVWNGIYKTCAGHMGKRWRPALWLIIFMVWKALPGLCGYSSFSARVLGLRKIYTAVRRKRLLDDCRR